MIYEGELALATKIVSELEELAKTPPTKDLIAVVDGLLKEVTNRNSGASAGRREIDNLRLELWLKLHSIAGALAREADPALTVAAAITLADMWKSAVEQQTH